MAESKKEPHPSDGGDYLYFKSFRHYLSGKQVYRKNGGYFRIPRRRR